MLRTICWCVEMVIGFGYFFLQRLKNISRIFLRLKCIQNFPHSLLETRLRSEFYCKIVHSGLKLRGKYCRKKKLKLVTRGFNLLKCVNYCQLCKLWSILFYRGNITSLLRQNFNVPWICTFLNFLPPHCNEPHQPGHKITETKFHSQWWIGGPSIKILHL